MPKIYNSQMPFSSAMADYSLETVLADQERFVSELFSKDKELSTYTRKKPQEFSDALRRESVLGIRDGIEAFIHAEKRRGTDHGSNVFDYDIAKFLSADLRSPLELRYTSSGIVRKHLAPEFKNGIYEIMIENLAYIVSEAYRARVMQLHLGEIKPRANPHGTAKSSGQL